MPRIAHAPNIGLAHLWVEQLQRAGIDASVQRGLLTSVVGDLPPDQSLPEIWVNEPTQVETGKALLAELQNPPQRRWFCRNCGEQIEGGFEQCWNCGELMPEGQ